MESPIELGKAWALIRKDMRNWSSYKSSVFTSIAGAIIGAASWGLLGTFNTASVTEYNTNYVSFLVVGILMTNMMMPVISGTSNRLSPWSLETILMTGISTPTYVLGTVGWGFIIAVIFTLPQFIISIILFPVILEINVISFILAFAISFVIMFSLGMISTGVKLVTKVTDPITWFLIAAQGLFAGMTFPVSHLDSILPGLSTVSWFIPQTWIYHIIRLSLLSDGSLADASVASAFLGATIIALILAPIGYYMFRWGLIRAKKEGNIGWY